MRKGKSLILREALSERLGRSYNNESITELKNEILKQQFEHWNSLDKEKIIVGFYGSAHPSASGLKDFALELRQYKQFDVSLIVTLESVVNATDTQLDWYTKNLGLFNIALVEEKDYLYLNKIKLYFSTESFFGISLPKEVIKICIPHGIDMSLEEIFTDAGVALDFDYVLSNKKQKEISHNEYLDVYPNCLINHTRPYICEIPFGSPKLDRFFNAVTNSASVGSAIVYHVSHLMFEENKDYIDHTLSILINNFKDHQIIFRPYPGPGGLEQSVIQKCIDKFSNKKNFYLSIGNSYVQEYACAAVMVVTRNYRDQLFKWATGREMIIYDPGYFFNGCTVNKSEDLINAVDEAINDTTSYSINFRKQKATSAGIYNLGHSIEYLVENIQYIINDVIHPDWKYTPIIEQGGPDLLPALELSKSTGINYHQLAIRAMEKFPDNVLIDFYAADALANMKSEISGFFNTLAIKILFKYINKLHSDSSYLDFIMSFWNKNGVSAFIEMLKYRHNLKLAPDGDEMFIFLRFFRDIEVAMHGNYELKNLIKERKLSDRLNVVHYEQNDRSLVPFTDIYIYGTGVYAELFVMQNGIDENFNILGVVDSNPEKQCTNFHGFTVRKPEVLMKCKNDILICSIGSADIINEKLKSELLVEGETFHLLF